MMDKHNASQIDWTRPPEVDGESGDWTSRWLHTAECDPREFGSGGAHHLPADIHTNVLAASVTRLRGGELRLDLRASLHPLDPEGYSAVDAVLNFLNDAIGLVLINGSERGKWRAFR